MERIYWEIFKLANDSLAKAIELLEASMKEKLKSLGLSPEEINFFKVLYISHHGKFETEITYKGDSCLFCLSLEDLLKIETSEELWEHVKVVEV